VFYDSDTALAEGINVRLVTEGVLTQPVFQIAMASGTTPAVSISPLQLLDRGQANGGRSGGFDPSIPLVTTTSAGDCDLLLAASKSNTDFLGQKISACPVAVTPTPPTPPTPGTPRTSWRQLQ
jgi:hypothetical protein